MPIERKLAAIMFTDIAGYTALSAKDETKALKLLDTQKEILTPIIKEFNGTLHKEIGDGLLFTFPTVSEAVKCGIKIQAQTKSSEDLNLRIGIHEGEVTLKDNDVLGDDVNIASRIEPFSAIGGIAVSGKVQQNISSLTEFETKYIGKPNLKGVSQEVKVYCISSHGLPQTDLSKVSAKLEKESSFNIFALTGGLLTLIGISFWIAISIFDLSFADENEVPSIGILMMENLGKEDEAFWSSGMTADLITKVTSAGLIRVSSLSDILKIDDDLSLDDKASILRVRYILSHQFLIKDDGFDLWCTLEDTKSGIALFSNKISEPMDMTTQIVGKLANDIVTSLKIETKQNMMKAPTANFEAYEFYLRAKNIYDKRTEGGDFQSISNDKKMAQELLNKAIELDENLLAARLLLGDTYESGANNPKAREDVMNIYTSALTKSKELDDRLWIGRSKAKIGRIHSRKGDKETALKYYESSLEISRELNDKLAMGSTLFGMGNVYAGIGDKQGHISDKNLALDYHKRSLKIFEELGDKHAILNSLLRIGWLYSNFIKFGYNTSEKDLDTALEYYESALELSKKLDSKMDMFGILNGLGRVYCNKGDYDKALDCFNKILKIDDQVGGASFFTAHWLSVIGDVYADKGDYDKALDCFNKALNLHENDGGENKYEIGRYLYNIGVIHYNKGDYDKAEEYLEKFLIIEKEKVFGAQYLLGSNLLLNLTYKHLGKDYDRIGVHTLIKEVENIKFGINLRLYELLEDRSYLETAYSQVQEKASGMEKEFAEKFFSYPLPKTILKEYNKLNKDKN